MELFWKRRFTGIRRLQRLGQRKLGQDLVHVPFGHQLFVSMHARLSQFGASLSSGCTSLATDFGGLRLARPSCSGWQEPSPAVDAAAGGSSRHGRTPSTWSSAAA